MVLLLTEKVCRSKIGWTGVQEASRCMHYLFWMSSNWNYELRKLRITLEDERSRLKMRKPEEEMTFRKTLIPEVVLFEYFSSSVQYILYKNGEPMTLFATCQAFKSRFRTETERFGWLLCTIVYNLVGSPCQIPFANFEDLNPRAMLWVPTALFATCSAFNSRFSRKTARSKVCFSDPLLEKHDVTVRFSVRPTVGFKRSPFQFPKANFEDL